MTQAYENIMEMKSIEVEVIEHPEVKKSAETEVDELLGDLNPRYFEENYTLDEAKQRAYSKHYNSDYSIIRIF